MAETDRFVLQGRDLTVAKFTEATGLAEIFRALKEQKGPALVRFSTFSVNVAFEALRAYAVAEFETLEQAGSAPVESAP